MEKIPTAENFLIINDDKDFRLSMSGRYVSEMMVEFAKLHVEAALKQASKKAICIEYMEGEYDVKTDSILNSYSLDNIK
jgi:hypothetical protein